MKQSMVDELNIIRARHLERSFSGGGYRADDDSWITINGTHVLVDENGELKGSVGQKIQKTSAKKQGNKKGKVRPAKRESASKEEVDSAVKINEADRNMAKVYVTKDFGEENRLAIQVALSWGDREHYERLTKEQMKMMNECVKKARKLNKKIEVRSRISDIDREIEKLHKENYKAQHYANSESGNWELSDRIEKKIASLEAEKKKLGK